MVPLKPTLPGLFRWRWAIVVAAALAVAVWLALTPAGLLGKADAVGYAVCHRIDLRSFHLGDRQMPLCARCSGMYLGFVAAAVLQLAWGRRGGMPGWKMYVFLALLLAAFGLDGVNSYLHFFPNFPTLYTPQNWLRLVTGTGMGIDIAVMLVPVFHQTMWTQWDGRPAFNTPWRFLALLGVEALVILAVLFENPFILFPLALIGSAGVLAVLSMVYTMVLAMLLKFENCFDRAAQLWLPILAGFTVALVQIGVMDLGRFWLTHTWAGFNF